MTTDKPEDHALSGDRPGARCAKCGGRIVPIAYGFPGPEMFAAAERGEIELGGCMVSEGQPLGRCSDCGAPAGSRTLR